VTAAGALLFARYAYPPNELGYCGPSDAAGLLRSEAAEEIGRRARKFDGAWAYLSFIASSAGIDDPLDERVVEAYWIGNSLLDRVAPAGLLAFLREQFAGQTGGTWRTAAAPLAHHSFQVFAVYPWASLLVATGNPTAVSILDSCRIRAGEVVRVAGGTAVVRSRPLSWDGASFGDGPPTETPMRWSAGGRSLIPAPSPGDLVALHWDWICDVITPAQAAAIEGLESRQRP
jgi:hypothetical protein